MSREIDKIKARLGAVGPTALNSCALSVRRLIEQDMPRLIRTFEATLDFITALDHVANYDKELEAMRRSLDLTYPV